MADIVPAAKRSEMMARIRAKDTKPEMLIRRLLHRLGFRFRLHRKDLPGKPDVVLPKFGAAVFVHGCFWHGHADCALFRLPLSRPEFWAEKIRGNRLRDQRNINALHATGWRVIVLWECAMKGSRALPASLLGDALTDFIRSGETFAEIRGTMNSSVSGLSAK